MGSYPPQGSGGEGTPWTYLFLETDATRVSTITPTNQAPFSVVIAPSTSIIFEMVLWYTSVFAPGIIYGFDVTASVVDARRTSGDISSLTGSNTIAIDGTTSIIASSDIAKEVIKIYGEVENSTSTNTLNFQWAQDISDVATITIHAGSYLRFKVVA